MEYLSRGDEFDGVYLIVSPKNPLKDSISADSGESRYKAAVEAVGRHPGLRVKVDDIEIRMEPPHYTIRTLDTLRRREPNNEFTLVIGADNLQDIHRWKDFDRILSEYGVAVYPRKGYDLDEIRRSLLEENEAYRIEVIDAPIVDISSTEIREGLQAGKNMSGFLI